MAFRILYRDDELVAIHKPQGFHVHQPEFPRRRVSRDVVCLNLLRDQINQYLYPIHRLDVSTEGVLVFALTSQAAGLMCKNFQEAGITKTYFAVARGYPPDEGKIDLPLALDSTGDMVEARTNFRTLQRIELPYAVGKRHSTARYALIEARPETGRFDQIRRHLARLSHPLIGDATHGDSHHNRFFREVLGCPGLWLMAKSIAFAHPTTGESIRIETEWSERWRKLFGTVGFAEPSDVTCA
jgi:tRNA pseudouridine65 synthase